MKLSRHALDNIELLKYVHLLNLPHFRGGFMKDKLPKIIKETECEIINLDSSKGSGTHWTAYVKKKNSIFYFDSYGNLRPPQEIVKYFYSDGKKIINIITCHNKNSNHKFWSTLKFLYKACR